MYSLFPVLGAEKSIHDLPLPRLRYLRGVFIDF